MNFFKRATTSITRRAGKTAILLALVFVLGNVIAGAFSIEQSLNNTKQSVLKGLVPMATLQQNYEYINTKTEEAMKETGLTWEDEEYWEKYNEISQEINDEFNKENRLTAELIEELGALPSVDFFDYSNNCGLSSKVVKKYYPDDLSEGYGAPKEGESDWFSLKGTQGVNLLDLKVGLIEMVEGRSFSESDINEEKPSEYKVLVSTQFAKVNELSVGDTFTLVSEVVKEEEYNEDNGFVTYGRKGSMVENSVIVDGGFSSVLPDIDIGEWTPPEVLSTLEFNFMVVGVYEANLPPNPSSSDSLKGGSDEYYKIERLNNIFISNQAIKEINSLVYAETIHHNPNGWTANGNQEMYEYLTPVFAFENEEGLNTFSDAIIARFGEAYWVVDNDIDFGAVVGPLQNMSSMAKIILYVGIGASLIILSLLITLFLKDRRNEIGIYLALGERKGRVVGQILAEVMIVAILGISMSVFSGNIIAGELAKSNIDRQVLEQQQSENNSRPTPPSYEYNQLKDMGYGSDLTLEEMADQYKVTLNSNIIIFFYGGGILTILLSTLIPIMYVLRLNPRKILM